MITFKISTSSKIIQNGFINIAFLPIFLVLIVAVFGFLQLFIFLNAEKSTLHICRKELLASQNTISRHMIDLISLNPHILKLRKAKLAAYSMMASPIPATIAAGAAILKAVKIAEKSIQLKQTFLLSQMRYEMLVSQSSVLNKIKKIYLGKVEINKKYLKSTQNIIPTYSNPNLTPAVQAIKYSDGPSEYQFKRRFTEEQTLSASWIYQLKNGDKSGNLWNKINIKKKYQCSASLQLKEQTPKAILVEDKVY